MSKFAINVTHGLVSVQKYLPEFCYFRKFFCF